MSVQSQDVYANATTLITGLGSGGGGGNVSSLTVSSIVVNGSTMVTSTMNVNNNMYVGAGRTGEVFFDVNISTISTVQCNIFGDVNAGFYLGTANIMRTTQMDAFLVGGVSSINGVNWAAITSTLHIP